MNAWIHTLRYETPIAPMQLYINSVSPTPRALGKMNSMFIGTSMALRGVLPGGISTIYALGIEHSILDGQLAWLILEVAAIIYVAVLVGPQRERGKKDVEEETGTIA